jgi:hypothetical protein
VTDGSVDAAVVSSNLVYLGGTSTRVRLRTGGWVPLDPNTGAYVGGLPEVVGAVYAMLPDGSGGWYVGGAFTQVGGLARNHVAQLDGAGNVGAWNPNVNGTVSALAARAVNLLGYVIYMGGDVTQVGG